MKQYQANEDLATVLLNHGFLDCSSKTDKIKGKRLFKLTKSSSKGIYFNYIHIQIEKSVHLMDSCYSMSEEELKLLLFFFKLEHADRIRILSYDHFTFKSMNEGLNRLKEDLELLQQLRQNSKKQKHYERILGLYNNFNIYL